MKIFQDLCYESGLIQNCVCFERHCFKEKVYGVCTVENEYRKYLSNDVEQDVQEHQNR